MGLDPRLCHSGRWEPEPGLGVQRCPVALAFGFLTAVLQRPEPELLDSVPHAAESARAVVEPIVLVVAVELPRQSRLLVANWVVPVYPDPRLDLAYKAFARLDARFPCDGHPTAASFRQVVDEAKESEGRRFQDLLPAPLQQASVKAQHCCLFRGDP